MTTGNETDSQNAKIEQRKDKQRTKRFGIETAKKHILSIRPKFKSKKNALEKQTEKQWRYDKRRSVVCCRYADILPPVSRLAGAFGKCV
jgi:hypothetical protein